MLHNVGAKPSNLEGVSFSVDRDPGGTEPVPTVFDFPPGAPGTREHRPPPEFVRKLDEHDRHMTCCWNPATRSFAIWKRKGAEWDLVTPVWDPATKQPIRPDNRILALLVDSDPRTYGGSRKMNRQVREWENGRKSSRLRQYQEFRRECVQLAKMHSKIRVGYGKSSGSKFAMQDRGGSRARPPLIG